MATPPTQVLANKSISLTAYAAGNVALGVVKDLTGAAIDISTWTFYPGFRPPSPNFVSNSSDPISLTVTGDASGNLTASWTGLHTILVPWLNGSFAILASNDGGTTKQTVATGSTSLNQN